MIPRLAPPEVCRLKTVFRLKTEDYRLLYFPPYETPSFLDHRCATGHPRRVAPGAVVGRYECAVRLANSRTGAGCVDGSQTGVRYEGLVQGQDRRRTGHESRRQVCRGSGDIGERGEEHPEEQIWVGRRRPTAGSPSGSARRDSTVRIRASARQHAGGVHVDAARYSGTQWAVRVDRPGGENVHVSVRRTGGRGHRRRRVRRTPGRTCRPDVQPTQGQELYRLHRNRERGRESRGPRWPRRSGTRTRR